MQQPCEQSIELFMMLNPGLTRNEALRQIARSAVEWELLRQRAMAGDREAVAQWREAQRELAQIFAQARAKQEAQVAGLSRLNAQRVPA